MSDAADSKITLSFSSSKIFGAIQVLTLGSVVTFGGFWQLGQNRQVDAVAKLDDRMAKLEQTLETELDRRRAAEAAAATAAAQAQATRTILEARIMKLEHCHKEPDRCDL